MLISVVIPVYNKEDYINSCIESVFSQTYKNYEIILINDGSSDNSENIIQKWSEKIDKIRYYKQENHGVSQARNKGIDLAKGDYVFFLDADDEIAPDALDCLVNNVKKHQSDIVMGNYLHVYEKCNKKRPQLSKFVFEKQDLYSSNVKIELFVTKSRLLSMVSNKLYSLEFIRRNNLRFDHGVLAEDRLFNLKSFVHKPTITAIADYTYLYNHQENSRSQSLKPTFYEESINLIHEYNRYLKTIDGYNSNNIELMELIAIYDVYKIISMTFDKSQHKYRALHKTIKRLRKDQLLMNNLSNVFKNDKYKGFNNKPFSRMRLLSYLLYKWPFMIIAYKLLGAVNKNILNLLRKPLNKKSASDRIL